MQLLKVTSKIQICYSKKCTKQKTCVTACRVLKQMNPSIAVNA